MSPDDGSELSKTPPGFAAPRVGRVILALLTAVLFAGAAGCVTDGARYVALARELEDAGDYAGARDARQRDLERRLMEETRPEIKRYTVMMATYELGRVTALTCDYGEGERLLREALRQSYDVDEQFSHRTAMLSELARLTLDAGEFADSVDFHRQALQRLDEVHFEQSDPVALAEFLASYAEALTATGDADGAAAATGRSSVLRELNPKRQAQFVARRYRDVCGKTQ